MSDSIHVPSSQVKRAKALAKFFIPIIMVAAGTAWTTAVTWFRTRTSVDEVRPLIAECNTIAKDAKSMAKEQHAQIYALQNTVLLLAEIEVGLHAQAEVNRAYANSKHYPEYVERARRFYAAEFARQQTMHPNDIVRALTLTRLAVWRPDRD